MRTAPGPRDWTPATDSTFDDPPIEPAGADYRLPRRRVSVWRGVGLLTLVTAATAIFTEVAIVLRPDLELWFRPLPTAAAIIVGVTALIVFPRLGPVDRIAAVMGLALGTISAVWLAASLSGFLTDMITEQRPAPSAAAIEQERTELTLVAETAASLLAGSFATAGAYPVELPLADGIITTPGGTVALPVGAQEAYSSDGTSFVLIVIGEHGTVAQVDSARGTVVTSLLNQ